MRPVAPDGRRGCAAVSRSLGEPLYGTASVATAWVLLEQPGPWGEDERASLDPRVARELSALRERLGFRLLLIRRKTGRYASSPRSCFLVHCGRPRPWMESVSLADPAELLDLDLSVLSGSQPPHIGTEVKRPLYLVCTHGRQDACCAQHGRPLARSLVGIHGERVWESSHVGGDRFAANLVCFPHALYYGRVSPADGARITAAYERGELDLECYRGRACDDWAVQSADLMIRRQTDFVGVDDLAFENRRDGNGGTVEVSFIHDSYRYVARSELVVDEVPRITACRSDELWRPERYELVELRCERAEVESVAETVAAGRGNESG